MALLTTMTASPLLLLLGYKQKHTKDLKEEKHVASPMLEQSS